MENPVERAVNEATSDSLQMPDQKLMKQVADLVNQRADQSKLAVQAIGKRLMQLRNGKVQALTMELIEYLAYTCDTPFYTQIATNDFLQRLNTLLNPQMNPQMQQRLLQVIFVLRSLMQQYQDLFPAFFQFLQKIQLKHQIPNNYESKYSVLRKAPVYNTSSVARNDTYGTDNSKNSKNAKLKKDLEIVKSNIYLTNEIIDNANPNEDASKNEILRDMTTTLRGVEEKLRNLIQDMGNNDEGLMSFCLELNDDLLKTFERYETLKKHKKPNPFKLQPPQQESQQSQQPQINQQPQAQPQFQQTPFTIPPPQQNVQPVLAPPPVQQPKPQQIDLLNLFEYDDPKPAQQQPAQQIPQQQQQQKPNIADLFDIDLPTTESQSSLQQNIPQQQQLTQQLPQVQNQIPTQQTQQLLQQPQIPQQPIQQQQFQPQQLTQQQVYQQAFPPYQQQLPPQQFQQQQYPGNQQTNIYNAFPTQSQVQPPYQQQYSNIQQYQQSPSQIPQQNRYQAFQQQTTQPIQQAFPPQPQGLQNLYGNAPTNYPVSNMQQQQQKKPENEFDDILNLAVSQKATTTTSQSQAQQQPQKFDLF